MWFIIQEVYVWQNKVNKYKNVKPNIKCDNKRKKCKKLWVYNFGIWIFSISTKLMWNTIVIVKVIKIDPGSSESLQKKTWAVHKKNNK